MVKRWSEETFRPFNFDGVFSVNIYLSGTGTALSPERRGSAIGPFGPFSTACCPAMTPL
jgi:hypothetical protein